MAVMTARAIVVAALCVMFVCGVTYFNDFVMKQTMFIGSHLPMAVYGILVVYLVFLHPLVRKMHRALTLRKGEMAVIVGAVLVACAIPGTNVMRTFTAQLVMPYRHNAIEPGWSECKIVEKAPKIMLADITSNEQAVVNGFITGLRQGTHHIAPSTVPWHAWIRPLTFWLPVLLTLWLAILGLSQVLYKQWAHNEHLPYPLMTFTEALFPRDRTGASPVTQQRMFWIGLVTVFAFHMYNFGALWFPETFPGKLPRQFDFQSLLRLVPSFESGQAQDLFNPTIFFSVIAIAYFLPVDVSLSLGIGPYLYRYILGLLAIYGIAQTGWYGGGRFGLNPIGMNMMGGYFGMFAVALYTARRHLKTVFGGALGFRMEDQPDGYAVWGARMFIFGLGSFVVYLYVTVGYDWPLSLLLALGCIAVFVAMSRLIAEAGVFFLGTTGSPASILLAILGPAALGPDTMVVGLMVMMVIYYSARECLMPFVTNALKLVDSCDVKLSRFTWVACGAILLGFAVAIPCTLYWQYDVGTQFGDEWAPLVVRSPFEDTVMFIHRLDAQGQLAGAGSVTGLRRFLEAQPHRLALTFFAVSAFGVLLFSFLRMRFAWWPLHPAMFITCGIYFGEALAASFILGWLVKLLVMRFGGATVYQHGKPLMYGLIAGEVLSCVVPLLVSTLYYFITGNQPLQFMVMPT